MANILFIEPDKGLSKTYVQAFEHVGHIIRIAATAEEAIMMADEQQPDVVVMELQLAGHNGIAFLHEFRSYGDWITTPVIINTYITPVIMAQAKKVLKTDLGVTAILYKPQTSLQRLISAVNEQVRP
jgi:DNA-binding response OmpR family regulator